MSGQLNSVDSRQWETVYNAGSSPVPPFGVMRSTGLDADKVYTIDQPNADSMTEVFVNGDLPIAPGTYGEGTRSDPATVLIETADGTPASGDDYGTQSGSWKAHKGKLGFRCMGSVGDNTIEATFYGSSWKRLSELSLTVQDDNTSPTTTVSLVSILVVDPVDGFSLSEVSAGKARLDLLSASVSQKGVVDGGGQSFAGLKTFTNNIVSEQVNFLTNCYAKGALDFDTDTVHLRSSDGADSVTMILNASGTGGYAGGALTLIAGWTSGFATAYPQLRLHNSAGSVVVGQDGTQAGMTYTSGLWTGGSFSVSTSDISGLDEAIDDRVAALLVAGTNITITYNDGANTLTIDAATGGITTLNTLTASTQTFAKTDDTNVTLSISSSTATHTFALGWTGQLAVPRGGTGLASATAYAVLCGGTTSTGAFQSVASVGTSGQVLTSNGAGALPTFQSLSSLDADLAAIAALTGTGVACRTAADTWALRTLTAGSAISVSNGSGASGNPTVAVDITGLTAITSGSGVDVSTDMLLLYDDSATANKKIAVRYIQALIEAAVTPPGLIVPYAGGSVPSGYLACDGTAVSRTTYAALFAAINTAYGPGDSSTTFNLPDLRGRFPLGVSGSHGIGTTGGAETHTLLTSEIPSHNHQIKSPNGSTMFTTGGGAANNVMSVVSAGISGSNHTTENSGSSGSHNNMPPYQAVNWLIKT